MIRRIAGKAYSKTAFIVKLYHWLKELTPPTATVRAIIPVAARYRALPYVFHQSSDVSHKIIGLVAFSEKQTGFATSCFQHASWYNFFYWHHIMAECLKVFAARPACARMVAEIDCCFCVYAYVDSIWPQVRVDIDKSWG